MAKIYSGDMTTETFGLLQGEKQKAWAREAGVEPLRRDYMNEEDVLRIYDTLRERMVYRIMHSGEVLAPVSTHPTAGDAVTEEALRGEAEQRLNSLIREHIAAYFCKERKQKKLGKLPHYEALQLDPRSRYLTREYYFDSNSGTTLQGHIEEITRRAPGVKVATR